LIDMRELTLLETGYLAGMLLLSLVLPLLMSACGPQAAAARKSCLRTVWMGQTLGAIAALAVLASASIAPYATAFGVTVVRSANGYAAQILPEFLYDRQALGNREARRQLTQQILRAFEPEIRRHPDQWFHFVPVWPQSP
jgi:lauroyl/myristoyl acyltransferase